MENAAPPDRLDVLDAVLRFAAAIDSRDWAAYRAAFTDDITIDYSSYRPGSIGPMPADDWVDRATQLFPGLDATQHTITNARVTIDGDRATCESYVRAAHALDGAVYTIAGHYTHGLTRPDPGRWLIHHVALRVAWTEGDREVLVRGAARVSR
jgi:ketosteroid isomerase-like protein